MESFEAEGAEGMTWPKTGTSRVPGTLRLSSHIPGTSLGRSLGLRGGNVQTFAQPLGCNAGGHVVFWSGNLTISLLGFEFASDPAAPFGKKKHGDSRGRALIFPSPLGETNDSDHSEKNTPTTTHTHKDRKQRGLPGLPMPVG